MTPQYQKALDFIQRISDRTGRPVDQEFHDLLHKAGYQSKIIDKQVKYKNPNKDVYLAKEKALEEALRDGRLYLKSEYN